MSLEDNTPAQDVVANSAAHYATLRALRSSLTKKARQVTGLTKISLGIKTNRRRRRVLLHRRSSFDQRRR